MLNAIHHPLYAGKTPAEHCMGRDDQGRPRFWTAPIPLEDALTAKVAPKTLAVQAYANHGRWVAECPDCCGAQLTAPEDPRFMCVECGNAGIGGLWRPVVWPNDHAKISALLDERPEAHTRNWVPGTMLREVKAGNLEHGVGAAT